MKKIFRLFSLLLFIATSAMADPMGFDPLEKQNIVIDNAILAKAGKKTISVLDVTKKMDMVFHQAYPDLANSKAARYEFYTNSWKYVLNEMINTELIIADAEEKKLNISDGEVREELESRFGPNVTLSLSQIDLTFHEAWEIIKRELTVRKMNMYYVNNRAFQKVNPQKIRDSYISFCEKNPPKENWNYQTITLRGTDEKSLKKAVENLQTHLAKHKPAPNELASIVSAFEEDNCSIKISKPFEQDTTKLSSLYLSVLQTLQEKQYSEPLLQKSNDKTVMRLFYLDSHKKEKAATFEEMAPKIRNQLLQDAANAEMQKYTAKLRKQYGFEKETALFVPDNFEPFRIE